MSEAAKTTTFVGAAVVVLLLAFLTRPKPPTVAQTLEAKKILNEVDDPLSASRLKIIKYDEDTSSIKPFEVAQVDGVWSIPSHQGYPADAKKQMADAATSVMNLKVLGVVSTSPAEHATYGVIDPDIEKLKPGAVGVGTRVTMENSAGDTLVNMIIGKKVKDQENQRYVREVGRDPVYLVKFDPSKLTTRFEDWIEADLLKLNPFDIRQVTLKDYSVELGLGAGGLSVLWDRRNQMTFAYDDKDAKWTAKQLKVYDKKARQFHTVELAKEEEVNNEKLNDLKNALDDLKIVDVERKPEGLSRDLKAEKDFATKEEAVRNLASRGFMPVQVGRDAYDILSSEGEALCQMKDGVEYVLRFGKLVMGSQADAGGGAKKKEASQEAKKGDAPADAKDSGIHRYLFVMARFNDHVIARPELEKLPELPKGAKAAKKEEGKQGEKQAQKQANDSDKKAQPDADAKAGSAPSPSADQAETAKEKGNAAGTKQPADAKQPAGPAESGKPAVDTPAATEKKKDADTGKKSQPADDALTALIAKRKKIEKENQRKLDDYQEKIKKAKKRVKELNDRFGDWYYVISDSVFKKIHLGRDDVIKKKETEADKKKKDAAETGPVGELNDLQQSVGGTQAEEAPAGNKPTAEKAEQPATKAAPAKPAAKAEPAKPAKQPAPAKPAAKAKPAKQPAAKPAAKAEPAKQPAAAAKPAKQPAVEKGTAKRRP